MRAWRSIISGVLGFVGTVAGKVVADLLVGKEVVFPRDGRTLVAAVLVGGFAAVVAHYLSTRQGEPSVGTAPGDSVRAMADVEKSVIIDGEIDVRGNAFGSVKQTAAKGLKIKVDSSEKR